MPLVEIHLSTLLLTALVIVYSDHQGYLYFRGKKEVLSQSFLKWSHRLVWLGLLGMITSGFFLLMPQWEYRLYQPEFLIKMGFVLVLIVNAFAIGKLSKVAGERSFSTLTPKEQQTLMISGALSSIGWVGAAVMGFLFI